MIVALPLSETKPEFVAFVKLDKVVFDISRDARSVSGMCSVVLSDVETGSAGFEDLRYCVLEGLLSLFIDDVGSSENGVPDIARTLSSATGDLIFLTLSRANATCLVRGCGIAGHSQHTGVGH